MSSVKTGSLLALCSLVLMAALWLPLPAAAQVTTGTLTGSVVDPQRQAIVAASITVVNEATGESRASASDDARGAFQFTNLPPGSYTVRIELPGFRALERAHVVLEAGARLSLGQLMLPVGDVTEVLNVEAAGAQVNTEETQHSGVITQVQIDHALALGRDVTAVMRLLPGVRYENTSDSLGMAQGTSVPNVGGAPRDWSNVIIDGVIANEVGSSSLLAQQINLDAIAEVKVLLSSYRAEYGRAGGAQVQIVSRSGTSDVRGSLYYYGRHEKLNAVNWFAERAAKQAGTEAVKPRYRFNTYGANVGGPVPKGKRLFFFYSLEAPQVNRPGPIRAFTVPTPAQLQGDFSQTTNAAGQLINIKDPLRAGACAPTGPPGPGCFPGNIIPLERINAGQGLALLKLLPLADESNPRAVLDRTISRGAFNYRTQENANNPKLNNIVRVDWRPSGNDSLAVTLKDWRSDQQGSEITSGPAKWGFFNSHYLNTDRGISVNYTKVLRSNLIFDMDFGSRLQTEQFYPLSEADWDRIDRGIVGFTVGQFHPELNPKNVIPKVTFGSTNLPSPPNFTFDNRLTDEARAWLTSLRANATWLRGTHTIKVGTYVEESRNSEGQGGIGSRSWAGEFNFAVDQSSPVNTNHPYASALLGVFTDYTEIDAFSEVRGRRPIVEAYAQDTWKPTRHLTVDYGMRFLWYAPWSSTVPSASFDPARFNPAAAPRLYRPARVNGVNVALDPVTGVELPNVFVGSFVLGTGDLFNGMVSSSEWDAGTYPPGFRESQGIEPEGRLGVAWDLFGDGKTALHASVGRHHNPHVNANALDQLARNPPAQNTPQLFYGSMSTMLSPGAAEAFAFRPSAVLGLQRDAPTPKSLNWSLGLQRDLGWGTVVDVTYVGSRMRNIPVSYDINSVPDGARFLDLHPENENPQAPGVGVPLPSDFLRPYQGFGPITLRQHTGYADYDALQIQVNRRYVRGLQMSVAYTLAQTYGGGASSPEREAPMWHEAQGPETQRHNLIFNYTWDIPDGSRLWNTSFVRGALDGWQVAGDTAFVSGDWAGVFFGTTDNLDFSGGDNGSRAVILPGADPAGGANRDPNPDGTGSWLDASAFARPNGRGDLGNAPVRFFRLPWVKQSNIAVFKTFDLGRSKHMQIRWEVYNLFNTVIWQDIDTFLLFNPAGEQVNPTFGKALSARDPRIMQGAIRFSF